MELIDKKKLLNTTRIYRDDPQDVIYRKYAVRQLIKSRPVVNAIPIPEGATNGDVLKAVFPKAIIVDVGRAVNVEFSEDEENWFDLDWWNAPYKGVEE